MSQATMMSKSADLYSLETTLNVTLATTINDVIGNTTSPNVADVLRTVAFLLFLITGFTLNCIQISVILQTTELRTDRFNILLISLAAVNLVDCLGNIPSTALDSHSRNGLWDNDNTLRTIDCIIVYLVGMVTVLGLLFMVADRLAEFQRSLGLTRHCPDTLTPLVCVRIMTAYSWIHGTILAIPLSLPGLGSIAGCPGQGRLAYLWTMTVIGFVLPILVLCCLYGYVICTALQQSTACRAYASGSAPEARSVVCLPDVGDFKYLAWLTVTWFAFQAPLLIMRFFAMTGRARGKQPQDNVVPRVSFGVAVALRWLFVAYTLLLPVLTFWWRRDACVTWRRILSCHKANIVVDSSPGHLSLPRPSPSPMQRNPFAVPVLFATANGLHVQMHHDQRTVKGISPGVSPTDSRTQGWDSSPEREKRKHAPPEITISKRCDVFGSFHSGDILSEDGNASECESSYDCNFFILQSMNPTKTTASCNVDHRTTSTDEQKKSPDSTGNSGHSGALYASGSSLIESPLEASKGAVVGQTKQKIEMSYLDTDAVHIAPEKRCSSDSGQGSVETTVKVEVNKLSAQGKQSTGTVWYTTETDLSGELHESAATFDPNGQEQPNRKKDRKRRKQRKGINSEGKTEATDSKNPTITANTQKQRARIEHAEVNSYLDLASVEQPPQHIDVFKVETNNNEPKTTRVKRSRQNSESSNNLLDSSNTSSEFTMLQSQTYQCAL